MCTLVQPEESKSALALPAATPLDEAAWQGWIAKGRAHERRSSAARMKAVKWASIAGLVAAAGFWSHLGPFEVVVRFLVTVSAIVVIFQAFQARYYAVAAGFGTLALFYNPVAPAFSFSAGWQRAVMLASAVPFAASLGLAQREECGAEHND